MAKPQEVLLGLVFMCPKTSNQYAVHKNMINFAFWDAGLIGFELDIQILECPGCNKEHTISLPLQIKV